MFTAIDALNWVGRRHSVRLPGRITLRSAMHLGLPRLLRIAGRRVVSASAGAPAIILTSGDIEKALHDPQLMYRALEFTVTDMHLDTFCTVADLSLEAEACGCQVQFQKRDMPSVLTHPVHNKDEIESLSIPDPEHDGRMPLNLEVMDLINRNYSMIKVATVTGPFTLSLQLCGGAIYLDAIKNAEKIDNIVKYSKNVTLSYSRALIKHGADMIIVMEPAVSLLSQKAFERFVSSAIDEIEKQISKPCIFHICGKAEHLVESMCKSDCAAFSIDEVDVKNLSKKLPRNSVVVGNISPLLLRYGKEDEIEKRTLELLNQIADKKEVIIAPGCDLAPETPLSNILAFVNTAKYQKVK
jgi:uroporphyrinogen decarboxylase